MNITNLHFKNLCTRAANPIWPTLKCLFFALLAIQISACKNTDNDPDAFGNFDANPIIVSSESAGKILQYNIKKGQNIEAGYLTAIIDTIQPVLKLKQLKARQTAVTAKRQTIQSQVNVYKEQIKTLKINEKRISNMLKEGASTQKQLDDINGQIAVLEKQIINIKTQFIAVNDELNVLEIQKEAAANLLDRCIVKSPTKGTILETYIEPGELVTPGKPLFKIASLDTLTLKAYITGAQLPSVKIGQQVSVIIDKSKTKNQTLDGWVTWISPEAEFTPKIIQTKKERVKLVYAVKIAVKNDGTLKIGMPGAINF
ncbi:MAG: HlyD family secretion protein [Draconibacterium sp.]|nr:MAG: HlyD family secretion protein [Draconibacterium sp.]PIF05094.1 MAG: HlyD family secretion protein [Draconibacterium sp.]